MPPWGTALKACEVDQLTAALPCAAPQQGPAKGYLELALDPEINRTGDVWHVCLPSLRDASQLCFGWRADSATCTEFVPGAAAAHDLLQQAGAMPCPYLASVLLCIAMELSA